MQCGLSKAKLYFCTPYTQKIYTVFFKLQQIFVFVYALNTEWTLTKCTWNVNSLNQQNDDMFLLAITRCIMAGFL